MEVEYTGVEVFSERTDIARVRLAPYVEAIGAGAFSECPNLREVELFGNNVTKIEECSFYGCSSLEHIRVPPTVVEIGDFAFYVCSMLIEVELCDGLQKIGNNAFAYCTSLERIDVPSTVTEIGEGAVHDCTALREVVLRGGIQKIGNRAFSYCESLESVAIPSTVATIGEFAFMRCTSLREVVFCEGLNEIGNGAFRACNLLQSVTIPSTVATIGEQAFIICESLMIVRFDEGIHHIKQRAFEDCNSLCSINIPPNSFAIDWSDVPRCQLLRDSTISPLVGLAGQTIVSGKLGASPHRSAEVEVRINAILDRQNEPKEEKLQLIRDFIGHFRMVDATTNLMLAIREARIDGHGQQDVESIIIGGTLPFLRSNNKWVYL